MLAPRGSRAAGRRWRETRTSASSEGAPSPTGFPFIPFQIGPVKQVSVKLMLSWKGTEKKVSSFTFQSPRLGVAAPSHWGGKKGRSPCSPPPAELRGPHLLGFPHATGGVPGGCTPRAGSPAGASSAPRRHGRLQHTGAKGRGVRAWALLQHAGTGDERQTGVRGRRDRCVRRWGDTDTDRLVRLPCWCKTPPCTLQGLRCLLGSCLYRNAGC